MNLTNISLISISRQKGKKIFLILALVLCSATIVAMFTFIKAQQSKIEHQFDEFGANIIISPRSDNLSLTYGGVNVSGVTTDLAQIKLSDIEKINTIPNKTNIRAVSPKIIGASDILTDGMTKTVLLIGVNFLYELKIKSWWEVIGSYPVLENEVIAGSEAASKLNLMPGSVIDIRGQSFIVTGVLQPTGSQDDNIIFGDFQVFAGILNKKGTVSLAEVSALCSDCPIDTIITQIKAVIPEADVKGIKQIMKQKMDTVAQFNKFAVVFTIVIIAVGAILIFISMMGSITERKHEIGIFRAIGFTKSHISTIILTESFIICLIAGLLGVLTGYLISFFLLPRFSDISTELINVNPVIFLSTVFASVLLGLIASIYPAQKAALTDPVETLSSL